MRGVSDRTPWREAVPNSLSAERGDSLCTSRLTSIEEQDEREVGRRKVVMLLCGRRVKDLGGEQRL